MKRPLIFDKASHRVFVGSCWFRDPKNVRVMGFYLYPATIPNDYRSFRPCWSMQ
jgi:hypothetical protein